MTPKSDMEKEMVTGTMTKIINSLEKDLKNGSIFEIESVERVMKLLD
jgi:hypothetical protein